MNKALNILVVIIVIAVIAGGAWVGYGWWQDRQEDDETDPYDEPSPNTKDPPIASFTYEEEDLVVGRNVTFDAGSSHAANYTNAVNKGIGRYQWMINGAVVDEVKNSTWITKFQAAGEYMVGLTVYDTDNTTGSVVKNVSVRPSDVSESVQVVLSDTSLGPDNDTVEFTVSSDVKMVKINITIQSTNGNQELPPDHEFTESEVVVTFKVNGLEIDDPMTYKLKPRSPKVPVASKSNESVYFKEDIFNSDNLSDEVLFVIELECKSGNLVFANVEYNISY